MPKNLNQTAQIPYFTSENYHVSAMKMMFYLKLHGLWYVTEAEIEPQPLPANPLLAQIRAFEKQKLKDRAIIFLHSRLS